jgi:hypothetical protein
MLGGVGSFVSFFMELREVQSTLAKCGFNHVVVNKVFNTFDQYGGKNSLLVPTHKRSDFKTRSTVPVCVPRLIARRMAELLKSRCSTPLTTMVPPYGIECLYLHNESQ